MKHKPDFPPEIKDTIQAIQRFLVAHRNKVIFIGGMATLSDKTNNTGAMFGFGNKEDLRDLLNNLRDMVEENADENGLVNF